MKVQIQNNSDIARYFVLDSLISMYQTKMHTKYSLIVNCSTFYFSDEGLSFTSYDWVQFLIKSLAWFYFVETFTSSTVPLKTVHERIICVLEFQIDDDGDNANVEHT